MRDDDIKLTELAAELGRRLLTKNLKLATAESCTGGWIAKCLTDIAGSSGWFDRGFITYSNAAKSAVLQVQEKTLAEQGAISEAVVREMAAGALTHSAATVAVLHATTTSLLPARSNTRVTATLRPRRSSGVLSP